MYSFGDTCKHLSSNPLSNSILFLRESRKHHIWWLNVPSSMGTPCTWATFLAYALQLTDQILLRQTYRAKNRRKGPFLSPICKFLSFEWAKSVPTSVTKKMPECLNKHFFFLFGNLVSVGDGGMGSTFPFLSDVCVCALVCCSCDHYGLFTFTRSSINQEALTSSRKGFCILWFFLCGLNTVINGTASKFERAWENNDRDWWITKECSVCAIQKSLASRVGCFCLHIEHWRCQNLKICLL